MMRRRRRNGEEMEKKSMKMDADAGQVPIVMSVGSWGSIWTSLK